MALGVRQVALQGAARRNVDGVVLVATDHDESAVAAPYAVLVAHVLGHAEGVVVLYVVDDDDYGLYTELNLNALQRSVHAVYGGLGKHVVGVGDVLRRVLQIGNRDVVSIPIGHRLGGVDCLRGGWRGLCSRGVANGYGRSATHHGRQRADDEYPPPQAPALGPFRVRAFIVLRQLVALADIFAGQRLVALGVLLLQVGCCQVPSIALGTLYRVGVVQGSDGLIVLAGQPVQMLGI